MSEALMAKDNIRKINQLGHSLAISIPKKLADQLGLSKGDEMEFHLNEKEEIVLRRNKKQAVFDKLDPEMVDMLHETLTEYDALMKSLKDK